MEPKDAMQTAIELGNDDGGDTTTEAPLAPTTAAMELISNSAPIPINNPNAAPIPEAEVENVEAIIAPPVLPQSEEEKDGSKAIQSLLDLGQKIDEKTLKEIGENDSKWQYNMTLGDLSQFKVQSLVDEGKQEEYWFAMSGKSTRKVFVSGKINRLSDIDSKEESFRCSLQLTLYWYITKEEYNQYIEYRDRGHGRDWIPDWYPVLRLPNVVEATKNGYIDSGRGKFIVTVPKKSGMGKQLDVDGSLQLSKKSVLCKAKYEIAGVFSEELEIKNFPFDVQPLGLTIHARVDPDDKIKALFSPMPRNIDFFKFDPRFSVYSEWDLDRFHVEFGDKDKKVKGQKGTTAINIRIIVSRRWKIYVLRSFGVIAIIDLLGLSGYVIADATERLNLLLALLLTIVVAMQELLNEPRITFIGKYSLWGFMYLVLLTAQATFVDRANEEDEDLDTFFLVGFSLLYIAAQIFWIFYAIWARIDEKKRSYSDVDQLDNYHGSVKLVSKWTKAKRTGKNGRLLAFESEIVKAGQAKVDDKAKDKDVEKMAKADSVKSNSSVGSS